MSDSGPANDSTKAAAVPQASVAAGVTLRPIEPADTPALLAVCVESGLFGPDDTAPLQAMFDAFHADAGHGRADHRALLVEDTGRGRLLGVAYAAPVEMTDRAWNLLLIAVVREHHNRGLGSRLLHAIESSVRAADGRLLLIETSSTPEFVGARAFYAGRGYAHVATIPDCYADGDGKVVFTRRLQPVVPA